MTPYQQYLRLADRLRVLCSAAPVGSESQETLLVASAAFEKLNLALRQEEQRSLFLASAVHDISALLAGNQIDPYQPTDDPVELARIKAQAVVQILAKLAADRPAP